MRQCDVKNVVFIDECHKQIFAKLHNDTLCVCFLFSLFKLNFIYLN